VNDGRQTGRQCSTAVHLTRLPVNSRMLPITEVDVTQAGPGGDCDCDAQ